MVIVLSVTTLVRQIRINRSLADTKTRISNLEESYSQINKKLLQASSSLSALQNDVEQFDSTITEIRGYSPTQDVLE